MQESIETLRTELEERLRFETLLAETSARFVNLPADRIDSEIEDAQRRMCESEEDLNRHLRSDEYRKVLLVMEMALRQPEIRFDTISSSTGFETIERARGLPL